MEEESEGLTLNNRKMSKKMNNTFLLAYTIYIFLSLKTLTHLQCIQLSQYNEKQVKAEDPAFGICESFLYPQTVKPFHTPDSSCCHPHLEITAIDVLTNTHSSSPCVARHLIYTSPVSLRVETKQLLAPNSIRNMKLIVDTLYHL